MLFNSLQFLLFFPIVVGLYFAIPHRYRWMLLLAASYYFYMSWRVEYILLLVGSTLINYYSAQEIYRTDNQRKRKVYLALSLCTSLGTLFAFKYLDFFGTSLNSLLGQIGLPYSVPLFHILLPVGISFYTFQTLSYTIDVYRARIEAEPHLGIFALYVSFFPQLVAGPIERAERLLPQFTREHQFDYIRVTDGLKLMAWGFFKKLVIADRLALLVNTVYGDPTSYTGTPLLLATYFFAFQIYCDFSGYSDIAIGAAQVLGFDLMKNFEQPYFSKSIAEFWRRWHISLSTWFRDYLYVPLGGSRVPIPHWYLNLLIVFVVSGLWHGANWTFVIWGALHGFYLIGSLWLARTSIAGHISAAAGKYPRFQALISIFITFHLVTFAWIFFRARSFADALYIVRHLFVGVEWKITGHNIMPGGAYELGIALLAILIMECVHLLQRRTSVRQIIMRQPGPVRWASYYALVVSILIFGKLGISEFIYFQF